MSPKPDRDAIGLPPRPFLYTLDQIASMTGIGEQTLKARHVWFDGRSIGSFQPHDLRARNIARPEDKPDWRVSEKDLIHWMKAKGFKYYERGRFS